MADSGHEHDDGTCFVDLTESPLDVAAVLDRVRSPKAGANVLFSGTTRDNFQGRAVSTLCYAAYQPRALRSMREIAADIRTRHGLLSVAIVHRLGPVPIGEDSVLIAVSAPHRKAAWQAGEECLERVKERVEIWKEEVFASGAVGDEGKGKGEGEGEGEPERVWRANKDSMLEKS